MRQFATGCAALLIFTISGQPIAVIEIHSPAMRLAALGIRRELRLLSRLSF